MTDRPTLVVLRALGLGDLLTAVPALRALAAAFPEHRRVLAAPTVAADLVAMIDVPAEAGGTAVPRPTTPEPAVHGIADTDFTREVGAIAAGTPVVPIGRSAVPETLVAPDVAVNLHGCGPGSHRALQALSPDRLVAFGSRDAGHDGPPWREEEHEVARWCRLLDYSGIPADPTDLRLRPPGVAAPAEAVGATLLHPGAAAPARRWPPQRWANVARAEVAAGRRVVVTGGPAEVGIATAVADAAGGGPIAVLAGRTSLGSLAAAVAVADVVVCGDTGVAHLATALGTSSVLLFGPTPPSRWGPFIDGDRHLVLWSGRSGDPHGRRPDEGLLTITPAAVCAALARLRSAGHDRGSGYTQRVDPVHS